MAIKIIKPTSSLSARVEAFSFARDNFPENDETPESSPDGATLFEHREMLPSRKSPQPMISAPFPLDPAQIEKSAYESGFRQGEKAGMEIAERKFEALMRSYSDAMLELGRGRKSIFAEAEREVVRLALAVARKIVHREILVDPQIIQSLVKVALNHVADRSAIRVRLHPTDHKYLIEHSSELSGGIREGELVLLADKSIQRGGCLIETASGNIDARIEEEFLEVERSFFEGQPS